MTFRRITYGHHITDENIRVVAETLKANFITQGVNSEILKHD